MNKKERYGYVYKITNNINGKIYIGLHKHNEDRIDENYWGSGLLISYAIAKEGKENFSREILEWCDNRESLIDREIYWIDKLDARNPEVGYNIASGGYGGDLGEIVRKRISEAQMGPKHWNYGKHRSEETKKKISESCKGIKRTEECRKRMSELKKQYYKTHSVPEDVRKRIGESSRNVSAETRYKRGSSNRGKKLSDEQKRKISTSMKEARKNVTYNLTCRKCGEHFTSKVPSRKYCDACRLEMKVNG